jgi:hypothetical protein
MNPALTDGGGQTEPTPTPQPSASPAVLVAAEEYKAFLQAKAELGTLKATQDLAIQQANAEKLKAITDKDELAKELDRQRQDAESKASESRREKADLESRWFGSEKSRAISAALDGHKFRDGARADVAALLDGEFETRLDAQGKPIVVQIGTARPIADVIGEIVPKRFAYALEPSTTGGSGANPGTPPASGDAAPPTTWGQALLASHRANEGANTPRWLQSASN